VGQDSGDGHLDELAGEHDDADADEQQRDHAQRQPGAGLGVALAHPGRAMRDRSTA